MSNVQVNISEYSQVVLDKPGDAEPRCNVLCTRRHSNSLPRTLQLLIYYIIIFISSSFCTEMFSNCIFYVCRVN